VLTDNGMAFAGLPKYRDGPTARWMGHIIEHRLTKPHHPWAKDQAERMNRTVKGPRHCLGPIKTFHHPGLEALDAHVLAFVQACNFAKHLKAALANPRPGNLRRLDQGPIDLQDQHAPPHPTGL
jgi:hypothetical protein